MLRLVTLGGAALQSHEGASPGRRPQDLAILARLAVAGERGLTRDKLVGYFWPDKDERHALHSLSQALYRMRVELDADDLFLGTRILRLNPARMSSDVADIERAIEAKDIGRVVELYGGPFLDALSLDEAPEFEQWVNGECRRFARLVAMCLKELASAATAAGDHRAGAAWWQRLVATDPLDGSVVLELVRALVAAGDRAGALREAQLHEALVRTELGTRPGPDLRRLLQQLVGDKRPTEERAKQFDTAAHPASQQALSSLTPEELVARARHALYQITAESFREGIRYAERAIQLAPDYGAAHATLGSLYVIVSQAEVAGNPRARGIEHCRRAASLDPQLAEAPLWLAWAAQLDGRFEEAETFALRGLALDPGALFAHSALAWTRLHFGLARGRWDKCIESIHAFVRAKEVHPGDPHMPIACAALYTLAGQYHNARELLLPVVDVERWEACEMRMIGALPLLARVHLHEGDQAGARHYFERSLTEYSNAPQVFEPYVRALTLCGLADLERQAGRYDEAVAQYVRAWELLDANPYLIGSGFLVVRLHTRLAGAFRRLRMREEENRHAAIAREVSESRNGYSFSWCWGVSEAELHYDWAVLSATCADRPAALSAFRKAACLGWREVGLVALEPAFAFCREDAELQIILRAARAKPPLPSFQEISAGRDLLIRAQQAMPSR